MSSAARPTTSAAAALTARYGKLCSIAQGRKPQGRPSAGSAAASASQRHSPAGSSSDAMPASRPIAFKNGVTLTDRRLLGKIFYTRHLKTKFDTLVEENRLRIRPHISKAATAKQVDNAIIDAFKQFGHNLVADGHTGFEYAAVSAGDHKLLTLGPVGNPKEHLNGNELAAEFSRRECFIVAKSKISIPAYEELLWGLADEVSSGEDDDMGTEREQEDYKKCAFCQNTFSTDTYDEHSSSCIQAWQRQAASVKTEVDVKQEPVGRPRLTPWTSTGSGNDTLFVPSGSTSPPHLPACWCGEPDNETLIKCRNEDCNTRRHQACSDDLGASNSFLCGTCSTIPSLSIDGLTHSVPAKLIDRPTTCATEPHTSTSQVIGETAEQPERMSSDSELSEGDLASVGRKRQGAHLQPPRLPPAVRRGSRPGRGPVTRI